MGGGDSPIPVSYNQNEWMGSFCPETHLQSAVISEVPTTLKAAGVGRGWKGSAGGLLYDVFGVDSVDFGVVFCQFSGRV